MVSKWPLMFMLLFPPLHRDASLFQPAQIIAFGKILPVHGQVGVIVLEDLKALEAEGVEILTCGTCLNYYGLTEKLAVGGVTNMYVIAEKMLNAGNVVKP